MDRPSYVTYDNLYRFVESAVREDVGAGDYSTLASVPASMQQRARLLVKDDCVLAGVELAVEIFRYYDNSLKVDVLKGDGEQAVRGDIAFVVSGKAQSILTMERLVLNCMQRMSGIATLSHEMTRLIAGTKARILDTRKTTPNFRMCEKWAVHIGGAQNHRFGLFDMIMLKDNHNDYAGGISKSVAATVDYLKRNGKELRIEVETRNLDEVREALSTNAVDIIMLDNMPLDQMKEAVNIIGGKAQTEASGGITKELLPAVAALGVDFISSGSVIYAAKVKDMSLKAFSG
jgi:nicotinate-nucleotide pyrophosphorylase (carboxylating)